MLTNEDFAGVLKSGFTGMSDDKKLFFKRFAEVCESGDLLPVPRHKPIADNVSVGLEDSLTRDELVFVGILSGMSVANYIERRK